MRNSNCGAAPGEWTEATFNPSIAKLRSWGAVRKHLPSCHLLWFRVVLLWSYFNLISSCFVVLFFALVCLFHYELFHLSVLSLSSLHVYPFCYSSFLSLWCDWSNELCVLKSLSSLQPFYFLISACDLFDGVSRFLRVIHFPSLPLSSFFPAPSSSTPTRLT